MSQSKINSNHSFGSRFVHNGVIAQERNEIAASGVLCNGDRGQFCCLRQGSGPTNSERFSHFCQPQSLTVPTESAGCVFSSLDAVLPLEARVRGPFGEEIGKSGLKVTQRLLDRDAADLIEPRVRNVLFQACQQSRGVVVANSFLPLEPSISPQAKHVVVDEADAAECLGKNSLLLNARVETKSVCPLDLHRIHDSRNACDNKPAKIIFSVRAKGVISRSRFV